ncbi:methyl-accepting chemotaxis protein [Oceanospirillum linum]|uniref:methyl-accepting chemotaxis protein n=1 Tax=Oceanospirillum linum TaxID=966 RepID=UPI001373398B|nr:methyl-accepting chemotaxis protein [Oceanospirillum linum]
MAAQLSVVIAVLMILANGLITITLTEKARENLETEAENALAQQSDLVSGMLEFYYRDSFLNAQRLSDIFFNMFPQGVRLSGQKVQVANYQTLALADESGAINGDFTKPDQFTRMTGGTATVFARHGDDFLRISTSLKKQNGERAFGTLLGTGHPGYKTLMAGKAYHGVAHLFGRDYMTIYRPVQDGGKTIAVLYIGFDLTKGLAELKKTLAKMRIGETGYATIVAGSDSKTPGKILMHPKLEGRNILQVTAEDGSSPFQVLLQNESGVLRYDDQVAGAGSREKLAAYRQIEGWGWVVLLGSYSDEFAGTSIMLRNTMIVLMLASTFVIILISGIMLYRRLSPLNKVTQDLVRIGRGDLKVQAERLTVDTDCNNETRLLRKATHEMHSGLKDLVTQLSQASAALKDSVVQVQGASANTENAVDQQSLEIQQVVSAMEEMSATTADVAENARGAADTTSLGQDKVSEGYDASDMVYSSIDILVSEMERASDFIQEVSTESNNISNFMNTISEVAEQTNLLALNAAIEAARAGESGRGFAVVADEVRTLAGRTQEATSEITQLVDRLQSKIDQAVQAISSSNQASRESRERTGEARVALKEIRSYMTDISDMGRSIAAAAEQQASVAETVTQSLHSIHQLSGHTRSQSDTTVAASESLQQVADDIEQKLSHFRL